MAKNKGEYVELDITTAVGQDLQRRAQAIPLHAGDLVTWDSRTTHANTENTSDATRMVVYLAAGPAQNHNAAAVAARIEALKTGIGSNVREALMHASKKSRFTDAAALACVRQPEQFNRLGQLLYGTYSYEKIAVTPAP
jgi:hypothetical protein